MTQSNWLTSILPCSVFVFLRVGSSFGEFPYNIDGVFWLMFSLCQNVVDVNTAIGDGNINGSANGNKIGNRSKRCKIWLDGKAFRLPREEAQGQLQRASDAEHARQSGAKEQCNRQEGDEEGVTRAGRRERDEEERSELRWRRTTKNRYPCTNQ
jgi:hypothetical protein